MENGQLHPILPSPLMAKIRSMFYSTPLEMHRDPLDECTVHLHRRQQRPDAFTCRAMNWNEFDTISCSNCGFINRPLSIDKIIVALYGILWSGCHEKEVFHSFMVSSGEVFSSLDCLIRSIVGRYLGGWIRM